MDTNSGNPEHIRLPTKAKPNSVMTLYRSGKR